MLNVVLLQVQRVILGHKASKETQVPLVALEQLGHRDSMGQQGQRVSRGKPEALDQLVKIFICIRRPTNSFVLELM